MYNRIQFVGVLTDWGWNNGAGTCKDASFTGCPIARYLSANNTKIESISDCKFNAFDLNNINTGQGSSHLIDWSNKFNYDEENQNVLLNTSKTCSPRLARTEKPKPNLNSSSNIIFVLRKTMLRTGVHVMRVMALSVRLLI